ALELDPTLVLAQVMHGRLLMMGGESEKALAEADKILAVDALNQGASLLRGASLAALGQEEEAVLVLEKLLVDGNKEADLFILLANLRLNSKDISGAQGYLEQLLENDSEHRAGRLLLAAVLERQKKLDEAEVQLNLLISQQEPDKQAEAKLLLVKFYIRNERFAAAEKELVAMAQAQPEEERFRVLLIRFYAEQKNEEKSLAVLEQGLKDLPESLVLTEMMAKYLMSKEKVDDAKVLLAGYSERLKTGPQFLRAQLLLAQIAVQQQQYDEALVLVDVVLAENNSDLSARILKGDLLLQRSDFDGAIAEYRATLKDVPQNVPVMFSLAKAHLGNQESSLGRELLQKAFDLDARIAPMAILLSRVYQQEGRFANALETAEKGLQQNPNNPELLELTTRLMVRRGRSADALELVRQYLAKSPDDSRLNVLLAQIQVSMRDFPPARERLLKELAVDADNRAALFTLVRLELLKGSPQEALARGRELRDKDPENLIYALLLANLYEQTGGFAEAAKIYEEVLGKKPNSLVAANNLAYYYAEHQPTAENITRAQELLEPYLEKFKDEPVLMDTAAWVYYRAGENEKALSLLSGVAEKIKEVPEALYHLGMINKAAGNLDAAIGYLQASLDGNEFAAKKAAVAALKELQSQ
ncbi:tetratricopeptide repeat protein, partial [bacterium]|nr:tetratricopeptide repeat protein [bacterium]